MWRHGSGERLEPEKETGESPCRCRGSEDKRLAGSGQRKQQEEVKKKDGILCVGGRLREPGNKRELQQPGKEKVALAQWRERCV